MKIKNIIKEEIRSFLSILSEGSVDKLKNDLFKTIESLKKNYPLYKAAKNDGDEKNWEKYRKIALDLTKKKKDLEKKLNSEIGNLYSDAELQLEGRGKRVTKSMWRKMTDDQKIDALGSATDDVDWAEDNFERKWNQLPDEYTANMWSL